MEAICEECIGVNFRYLTAQEHFGVSFWYLTTQNHSMPITSYDTCSNSESSAASFFNGNVEIALATKVIKLVATVTSSE